MAGGAVVAAAAAARQRRIQEVVDAFRVGDATAPERAKSIDQLGLLHIAEAEELLSEGVLAPGARDGTFYLNEHAYIERRDASSDRKGVLVVLAIIAIFIGAALMLRAVSQ